MMFQLTMKRSSAFKWMALLVIVAAALFAGKVFGQVAPTPNAGILDEIMSTFMQKAVGWEAKTRAVATNFFAYGVVISLAWTGIRLALKGKDFEGLIGTISMQILTIGFFYMLVLKGPWMAGLIMGSFTDAGKNISGAGQLSPSLIVQLGFDSLFRILETLGDMGWGDKASIGLALIFAGLTILFSFAAIAILFLLTAIEAYFVMYAGLIMLGFGALPWTRDIPKNYLVYAINVGVRLFVLYLVVGVGMDMAKQWPAMLSAGDPSKDALHNAFYIAVAAVVFMAVSWKVPGIAGALTSGAVNMSASDGIGAAAAVVGGAAGATGVVGAIAGKGAGAFGGAFKGTTQAVTAGIGLAKEQGASGMAAAVKGVGNAVGAMASEAKHGAGARLGTKPKSANAVDSHGRDISNLGTRAANNLGGQAQATKEATAATPGGGNKGMPGQSQASPASNVAPGANTTAPAGNGMPEFMRPQAGPEAGPASAPPAAAAPDKPTHDAGPDKSGGKSIGETLRQAAPPPMPAEGVGGGVQVNLNSGED
jgi:type IV secretion system protein TrbL